VIALAEAGERARGGTLVVTLEPCAHTQKKTPPCVPAVIASGVARVVAAMPDPNPDTGGKARAAFSAAGVGYEDGVLRDQCEALVARCERHRTSDVPWTVAKWAMSADGRIADSGGHSRWITDAPARDVVHELRATVDAVIVGRGTVIADDPLLTCRLPGRVASPLRVVLDTDLHTPSDARIVTTARETGTLVFCAEEPDPIRRHSLQERGVEVFELPRGPNRRVKLAAAFRELHRRGVRRALLESGPVLTAACIRAGYVRQVAAFVAPTVIGGTGPTPFDGGGWPLAAAPRLEEARAAGIGQDALLEGYWPRGAAQA
jgi:diaminohydroxyphosphoribosylaminopyrimidine deaminase / 5-amino-6-(5-phosphoribosylamino)uracil reductase